MAITVAAVFDDSSWPTSGQDWVRSSASLGRKGFVFGPTAATDCGTFCEKLGFERYDVGVDPYGLLASEVPDGGYACLSTNVCPDSLTPSGDVVCGLSTLSPLEVVLPVRSLNDRASCVRLLQDEVLPRFGALLSPACLVGSSRFWQLYSGFRTSLFRHRYADPLGLFDDVALNLFAALFRTCEFSVNQELGRGFQDFGSPGT